MCLQLAQGRKAQILSFVSNKYPWKASRKGDDLPHERLHKRTTVGPRNKPCDLYLVRYEGFLEEEHWTWEPSYKIPKCLIRRFVNPFFANRAIQSGYKGRKCPKCQRNFFISNQSSIPVHLLHLFGRSSESRRKKRNLELTLFESNQSSRTHRLRNDSVRLYF